MKIWNHVIKKYNLGYSADKCNLKPSLIIHHFELVVVMIFEI